MSPRFQLELDQERYTPGDTIRGTILVLEGGSSRSLEALLEYHEKTDDYSHIAASIPSGPLHTDDLATGRAFQFELSLPPNAFPNYRSENGELYWELDIKSDEFGRDTHERHRIEVGPAQRTAPASGASAGA
jgi:hypothetical protein